MAKRFMFVGSLPTKKLYFDGERNKSRDVLNALRRKYGDRCSIINLSLNQYFQVAKMLILSFFISYDFIFVSKCLVGGSKAIRLLLKFAKKSNRDKIVFYLIGNGSNGFEDKTIYFDDVKKASFFILESPLVQQELLEKKVASEDKIVILPCIKPDYDLPITQKTYPHKPLRLVFFSRVTPLKGLMDAINAVIAVNKKAGETLFTLDIAGGAGSTEEELAFLEDVKKADSEYDYIHFLGLTLRIEGKSSYERLQAYDMHIFPSKFFQECAPGSVIDMFIAGIPTLSSNFPSSRFLMDETNSYFFKMGDVDDLEKQLLHVYNHQEELNEKRIRSHENAPLYGEKHFMEAVEGILKKIG